MAGTWVFYYIQGEEGESEQSLNALKVKSSHSNITLDQFLSSMPILGGKPPNYHCRFRTADSISGYVWLDILDPTTVLPHYQDMICAKLLRLNSLPKPNPTRLRRKPLKSLATYPIPSTKPTDFNSGSSARSATAPPIAPVKPNATPVVRHLSSHKDHIIEKDNRNSNRSPTTTSASKVLPPPRVAVQKPPDDLLNFGFDSKDPITVLRSTSPTPAQDLMYNVPLSNSVHAKQQTNQNFQKATNGNKDGKSEYVAKRMEERAMKIEDDMQRAVQNKKDRDVFLAQQQEDFDAAKLKYDSKLSEWAEDHGCKRNIRTLLSTMDKVLWENSRWKPIGIGDILAPSKVKLAYRRAMLVVHPDKCTEQTNDEKFIAKRIFEALNEAWRDFSAKEMTS